jgi:hypothetical protein
MKDQRKGDVVYAKRLAQVEVDPSRSNQHELNADRIRRVLGFSDEDASGIISFLVYADDLTQPVSFEEQFTLYDARKNHPTRTEWRLYYAGTRLSAHAKAGDLLILTRPSQKSNNLVAIVARIGTEVEKSLIAGLSIDIPESGVDTSDTQMSLSLSAVRAVVAPLQRPEVAAPPGFDYDTHPLLKRALAVSEFPRPREMAAAAQQIVRSVFSRKLDPDRFIEESLDAESQLFFRIEEALGNRALSSLQKTPGLDFTNVMKLAVSYSQRRRQRRGDSLQNHFAALLADRGIPFKAQCLTERGETPDFIVPGGKEYHDPAFPASRLRMVGCKTKVRERYRQWLKEADRVEIKYGLCVDEGLSDDQITRYRETLKYFLPRRMLQRAYGSRGVATELGTIEQLVADLEATASLA